MCIRDSPYSLPACLYLPCDGAFGICLPTWGLHHDFCIPLRTIAVPVRHFMAGCCHACVLEIRIVAFPVYLRTERLCTYSRNGRLATRRSLRVLRSLDSGRCLFPVYLPTLPPPNVTTYSKKSRNKYTGEKWLIIKKIHINRFLMCWETNSICSCFPKRESRRGTYVVPLFAKKWV
mgnify:CR=1 FL=1